MGLDVASALLRTAGISAETVDRIQNNPSGTSTTTLFNAFVNNNDPSDLVVTPNLIITSEGPNKHAYEAYHQLEGIVYCLSSALGDVESRERFMDGVGSEPNQDRLTILTESLETIGQKLSMTLNSDPYLRKLELTIGRIKLHAAHQGVRESIDDDYSPSESLLDPESSQKKLQNLTSELIVDVLNVCQILQKDIEERQGSHGDYCADSVSINAQKGAELAKVVVKQLFDPENKFIFPGDIEFNKQAEAIMVEIDKLGEGWAPMRLLKLLNNVRSSVFLRDENLRALFSDKEVDDAKMAFYRTFMNFTIGMVDFIPGGLGDIPSWVADGLKIVKSAQSKIIWLNRFFPKYFDLTPGVPLSGALLTEFMEIPSGGFFPSHFYEFIVRFREDFPIMLEFLDKLARERSLLMIEDAEAAVQVLGMDSINDDPKELAQALRDFNVKLGKLDK